MEERRQKPLSELTLLDKFLFDEVMEDAESVKVLLDIIFDQNTEVKYPPQTEKEQRAATKNRGIRLDVYAMDEDDVIYNLEAQRKNTKNLPKRSRLYQGIIDSKLLPVGAFDFNEMNDVIIIMIAPFDLFGYGLYRYTFQMLCKEITELELSDGATRVFLNSHGKRKDMVSEELIELLHYMEETTDQVAKASKSEKIQKLHERVKRIRLNEDLEVKYMQTWEEKAMERAEGRREGWIAGEREGRIAGEREGRIVGEREGRIEGRAEEQQKIIRKMSESLSVKEIAQLLGIEEGAVKNAVSKKEIE